MAKKPVVAGKKLARGSTLKTGKGWTLVSPGDKGFKASLHATFKIGGERIVVFHVPDPKD